MHSRVFQTHLMFLGTERMPQPKLNVNKI